MSVIAWLTSVVVLATSGLFLWSGTIKLLHIKGFRNAIAEYEVIGTVPESFIIRIATFLVPLAELYVAGGLLLTPRSPFVLLTALLLLGAFSFAIAINLYRGTYVRCACQGAWSQERISFEHIHRNIALVAVVVFASSAEPLTALVTSAGTLAATVAMSFFLTLLLAELPTVLRVAGASRPVSGTR